jgi:CRP-like cAMP-binding protein
MNGQVSNAGTIERICHVLREDPDLVDALAPEEREAAMEECIAPVMTVGRGSWAGLSPGTSMQGIGLLVLEGLLIRRVGVEGRFGAELLGEGDLLRPWQPDEWQATLPRITGWRVLEPSRLALLDVEAARCFSHYPALTGRLVDRALERARNLVVNMAIVHQARVDVRLRMLLWHLAERWGRVRSDGVIVPLPLTHEVLAQLVAARRPTVSSALSELGRRGLVMQENRVWRLSGEKPGELLALQGLDIEGKRRRTAV